MRVRKDNLPTRDCEWCHQPFRAERYIRRCAIQRFHSRACFYAAKRAWGVIRRAA